MEVDSVKRPPETEPYLPRKIFKISELPLNSTQRSTIDGLLHTIKKKGEYDTLRKRVWAQYMDSVRIDRRFTVQTQSARFTFRAN